MKRVRRTKKREKRRRMRTRETRRIAIGTPTAKIDRWWWALKDLTFEVTNTITESLRFFTGRRNKIIDWV